MLLVHGGTENRSPQRWKTRSDDVCGDRQVALMPDAQVDPAEALRRGLEASPGRTRRLPEPARHFQLRRGRRRADGGYVAAWCAEVLKR